MLCPNCGTDTPAPATACPACRTPFPSTSALASESATISLGSRATPGPGRTPGSGGAGPLAPGAAFGSRYRILRELGAGGMGVVYQAWDASLGVAVALKVVRPEVDANAEVAQAVERRFKRELLLARQVTHKHVVRIHDLGEMDGIKYITMPYIEGEDLATVLRRDGRVAMEQALKVAKQIASGLQAAHDAGVVHRDLKPANIMIDADANALIMDFGIALSAAPSNARDAVDAAASRALSPAAAGGGTFLGETHVTGAELSTRGGTVFSTSAGAIIGTLEYMAPEQAKGEPVDHRADIYAFGLIVSDMLIGARTGAPGATPLGLLSARVTTPPQSLRARDETIPEPVDALVGRCLQLDPADRFQTTAELVGALDRLDSQGHLLPEPTRGMTRQAKAASVAVVAILLTGTWWLSRNPVPPPPPAPLSVLVADFANSTGDPVFDGSLEQALGIAMEGASFITAYPRTDAQQIAQRQNLGPSLTESVATLVAAREEINVLLVGAIAPASGGYRLTLRAVNPREEKKPSATIASWEATASSPEGVLAAVATFAGKARTALGDSATDDLRRAFGETVTASSLDAIREYSEAQALSLRGKDAEAIPHYQKAIAHDPKFGRAYAGWAVSAHSLGQTEVEKEQWKKALELTSAMTEREKYRTLGGYFLTTVQDYDQAVENYRTLVEKYPADTAGHSNLALAYFFLLKFPEALAEGRRAVELNPKSVRFLTNYALYAMYASDFKAAEEQSREVIAQNPGFYLPYFPLAAAQIMQGKADEARATYAKMAGTGATGASQASMGLADLALYEGRPADAEPILRRGIEADRAAGATASATTKLLALAETRLSLGRAGEAAADAARAAATQKTPDVLLPAARILIAAGREADAAAIAANLEQQLQPQSRAYGKIIRGDIALANKRFSDAVQQYRSAKDLRDIWVARFGLGVAYVESGATGAFALASTELEACLNRRGEATALFLDEVPTFRYFAPLRYWLGRAKEGLNRADAAADYRAFLALRPGDSRDPLAADARRRLRQ